MIEGNETVTPKVEEKPLDLLDPEFLWEIDQEVRRMQETEGKGLQDPTAEDMAQIVY